jgi:hypothetical protein
MFWTRLVVSSYSIWLCSVGLEARQMQGKPSHRVQSDAVELPANPLCLLLLFPHHFRGIARHFWTVCTIFTHAALWLHHHHMPLLTGGKYWWTLMGDTYFAHKIQITLQTSLWDHISNAIATAYYQLIHWKASDWLNLTSSVACYPTANATSYRKIKCSINTDLTG